MLNASPEYVLRAYYNAWIDYDIERALEYVADDVVYIMHLERDLFTFAGETHDKAGMRQRMIDLRSQFELLAFTPLDITAVGQQVRSRVESEFRHRASGQSIDGTFRHAVVVEQGQIVRMEEYHDAERVAAFMRLVMQGPKTPEV